MAFQLIGPGFPENLPEPPDGFFRWDGWNGANEQRQHVGYIQWLEFQMRQQVVNLGPGDDILGGLQNMNERVTLSLQELSNAVNPATPFPNHARRCEEVNRICDTVSVLEPVVPAPGAVVPENDQNAHVHHFRLHLNGERLGPLNQLIHLVKARENVTSGRHTMRGVNYDAMQQVVNLAGENQEEPEWKIFFNESVGVARNAHASHDVYREAFDMGPHVCPFHWQQPLPLVLAIMRFVAHAWSRSGGAHDIETWGQQPAPLVVPEGAPPLPHPWDVAEGEMPRLNAFARHTDEYHVRRPWTMLIMQVSVVSHP